MTQKSISSALVSALSPICVDKFQHSADAAANLTELKKVNSGNKAPSSRRAAGRRCPAARSQTRRSRNPAPPRSAAWTNRSTPPCIAAHGWRLPQPGGSACGAQAARIATRRHTEWPDTSRQDLYMRDQRMTFLPSSCLGMPICPTTPLVRAGRAWFRQPSLSMRIGCLEELQGCGARLRR
jgi:hypothetical protein